MAALDDYRWLTSPVGESYLERAAESTAPVLKLATSLRRDLSPERTHLVLEQIDLRRRGREKFPDADRMFFTRKGLEQSTDHAIATYKAARFRHGESFDYCCGIGGDLLAIGNAGGHVTGVELDPITAHLAATNCERANLTWARVVVAKAEDLPPGRDQSWHIDPDRRLVKERASQIEHYAPGVEHWLSLLDRQLRGAIKLAPAAKVPERIAEECYRVWLESRGECRQQVAWHPYTAMSGERSAGIINSLGIEIDGVMSGEDENLSVGNRVFRYVYEPRACVLASGLVAQLNCGGWASALARGSVYLTSDQLRQRPLMATFEVSLVAPYDLKQLKAIVKERQLGRLEIKCRGVDIDPEQVRKQLKTPGDEQATLILAQLPEGMRAIFAKRLWLDEGMYVENCRAAARRTREVQVEEMND